MPDLTSLNQNHQLTPCQAYGDPDLWFETNKPNIELAKQLCNDCPVMQECLEGAQKRREPYGVWGGELLHNGKIVTRSRRRARNSAEQKDLIPLAIAG